MSDSGKPVSDFDERFIGWLKKAIRWAVRVLAVLMMLVIWWGVADVIYVLAERMAVHPYMLLNISDILATFGAFMAVLIAIATLVSLDHAGATRRPARRARTWRLPASAVLL